VAVGEYSYVLLEIVTVLSVSTCLIRGKDVSIAAFIAASFTAELNFESLLSSKRMFSLLTILVPVVDTD